MNQELLNKYGLKEIKYTYEDILKALNLPEGTRLRALRGCHDIEYFLQALIPLELDKIIAKTDRSTQ